MLVLLATSVRRMAHSVSYTPVTRLIAVTMALWAAVTVPPK